MYMICNAKSLANVAPGKFWRRPKEIEVNMNLHTKTLYVENIGRETRGNPNSAFPFLQKLQPSKCWISIYAPIQFVLQVLQRKEIQRVSLRNNASIYKSPPVIQLDSLPSTHINASNSCL